MATAYQLFLGQSSSNTFSPTVRINGQATWRGDLENEDTTAAQGSTIGSLVSFPSFGLLSGGGFPPIHPKRQDVFWRYTLPSTLPRKAVIIKATLRLRIMTGLVLETGGGSTDLTKYPAGGATFSIYQVPPETPIIASMDFRKPNTALSRTWSRGFGPKPGEDIYTNPVGSFTVSLDEIQSILGQPSSTYIMKDVDITAAVQEAANTGLDMQLIMPNLQEPIPGGIFSMLLDNPSHSDFINQIHSHIQVDFRPELGFFGTLETSGHPIDINDILNPIMPDPSQHLYLGTPTEGNVGDTYKYFARMNRQGGTARLVTIEAARSDVKNIDSSLSVSTKELRYIDPYDNNTGELTPEGQIRIIPDSGDLTKYKFGFTPAGSSTETFLAEETTGLTSVTFASNHVFMYGGLRAFRVRAVKWSSTAANVNDVWKAVSVSDNRPTGYSVDTLAMTYLMPATTENGDTANTSSRRQAFLAKTMQLYKPATLVDIGGGVMRTLVPLPDTGHCRNGQAGTICNGDGSGKAHATILKVYDSTGFDGDVTTDVTRKDCIILDQNLGTYASSAVFTTGLQLGNLTNSVESFISEEAVISTYTVTASKISLVATKLTLIDPYTGNNGVFTILSRAGNTYTLDPSTPLNHTYPIGTIAVPAETDSNKPLFIQADVPGGQLLGRYLGFIRVNETVLVNRL